MSDPKEEFGLNKVFKSLRIAHGYSIIDLADKMGMSASKITEIELNQRQPTLNDIIKYSRVFKISKTALLIFGKNESNLKYYLPHQIYKLLEGLIENFNIEVT